jgi:hypothetical protein
MYYSTKQFIDSTLANGGGTVWLGQESYTGYVVAVYGRELIISVDEFKRGSTLKQFIESAYDTGFNIVGSWVHEGQVYLDCCKHFNYVNEADNFARANKQLAYYNISGAFVIEC